MTTEESETRELNRRLEELQNQISENIDAESENLRDLKSSANRLGELTFDLSTQLEENENLQHERATQDLIDDIQGEIVALEDKINEVEHSRGNIKSMNRKLENIRTAVASVVEEGLDSKIVREFGNRKEKLESALLWWKIWTGISVLIMFAATIYLYLDISSSTNVASATISKVTLLGPVLIVVWFSFNQYNRHKTLIEQYEFKMSMADSLMGFREILKEDFSDDEQDLVGEFVIESVDRMYSDPSNSGDTNTSDTPQASLGILQALRGGN